MRWFAICTSDRMRCLLVIAVMATTAHADPERAKIGVGASFFRPPSVGASVFLGFTRQQAVHVRAARYLPIQSIDAERDFEGRIYEVGVSWAVFSHRMLDGVSLELGAFGRNSDFGRTGEMSTRRRSESFGARAFVGYNLMIADQVFIGFALGLSKWIEKGTDDRGTTMKPILDTPLELDGYFRVGFTFDGPMPCR